MTSSRQTRLSESCADRDSRQPSSFCSQSSMSGPAPTRPDTPGIASTKTSVTSFSRGASGSIERLDASQCTDARVDLEGYEPDAPITYVQVLSSSIIELIVGSEKQCFRVHRNVIIPGVPYLADLLLHSPHIDVLYLPEDSPLPVAAVIEYLYVGDRWTPPYSNPFVDKVDLKTKLALAEVFILAEKWKIPFVCRACVDALAIVPLSIPDQLQYWRFVYSKTAPGSAIRIPNQRHVSAKLFIRGLEQSDLLADLAGASPDLVFDLLMLSVHESM